MSPRLSKHRPFVMFSVGLPCTVVGLIVIIGVGVPLAIRLALANSTNVNGGFALLDQRLPAASNASSQGPWIEPWPLSVSVRSGVSMGVSMPVVETIGRCAAANSTMVVPTGLLVVALIGTSPLLATHRLPALSKTIPSGPLNAADEITTAGISALVPVMLSCAAVNTRM